MARLAETVEVLATSTSVRKIHIVSWSAGARVLSHALVELAGNDAGAARERWRLGTVVFAAGDVPKDEFVARLPAIYGLADRVIVYLSDSDFALRWATRLMGGGERLGAEPRHLTEGDIQLLLAMPRLEVVDTSYGNQARGFNITGHRYWFQHPWVNSDLVLALRTGAGARARGLEPAPVRGVWAFGPGYPEKIGGVARDLTDGQR